MAEADVVLTRQGKALIALAITAATLMGGFLTFVFALSDRFVTKELFNARMETMDAKVTGSAAVLSAQIEALRAEIRSSGSSR